MKSPMTPLCGTLARLNPMNPILKTITRWFHPRPEVAQAARLYASIVTQARQPTFFEALNMSDEIGIRFELVCLHACFCVLALRDLDGDARQGFGHDLAQSLFDRFLKALDDTLREQGVGDLSVPKKMKPLIGSVYARLNLWEDLRKSGFDKSKTVAGIVETLYPDFDSDPKERDAVYDYVGRLDQMTKSQVILKDPVIWPDILSSNVKQVRKGAL